MWMRTTFGTTWPMCGPWTWVINKSRPSLILLFSLLTTRDTTQIRGNGRRRVLLAINHGGGRATRSASYRTPSESSSLVAMQRTCRKT
mgnify:CR=1 FL=1